MDKRTEAFDPSIAEVMRCPLTPESQPVDEELNLLQTSLHSRY